MQYDLQRFLTAQQTDYPIALAEIKQGHKRSHWIWYIFPQIAGLGFSATSKHYALQNAEEAEAYLNHPILGKRLVEICSELLKLPTNNATQIFGTPDDMKLRSSMTLFAQVENADPVFTKVLLKFFSGYDPMTLELLGK